MKVKNQRVWKWMFAIASFLLAVVYGFTIGAQGYRTLICSVVGGETYKTVIDGDASVLEAYSNNGQTLEEWMETSDQLVQEIEGEGPVLMKNDDQVLPLAEGSSVTLFSRSSVDLVLGGTGGGGFKSTRIVDLKTALEDVGFQVNQTIWDFYKSYDGKSGYVRKGDTNPFGTSDDMIFVGEVPLEEYPQTVRDSYTSYNDAAIVVISRIGGEGTDMPLGDFGDGSKYLALQETEKDLLKEIQSSGQFDKVVVLLNTSNAMEMSWLDEAQYGVDACLWIGGVGQSGARAVADILQGAINPSGHLVDTYATSSFSAPAIQNFGNFTFSNADEVEAQAPGMLGTHYVIYQEGIYIGYRYYETRYADSVMDPTGTHATSEAGSSTGGAWNYTDEVDFSFGYGLSYGCENGTPFTQTITGFTVNDDTVDFTVNVRNDGDTAGKSVVQLYVSAPYTPGGTEKSAVVLAGFAKTDILAPGAEEDVTISVDKYDFASYDYVNEKTYVLDAGEYYFAIGNGAHDALNNILAAQGYTTADGMDYDGDGTEGAVRSWNNPSQRLFNTSIHGVEVTNQFDHVGLDYYGKEISYLTRSNWDTFPTPYADLEATQEMIDEINAEALYEPGSSDISTVPMGVENPDLNFVDMVQEDYTVVPFDDPSWDELLDQLTLEDMVAMVTVSARRPVEVINYPAMNFQGGASGNNTRPYTDSEEFTTGYCSEVVFASTFNTALIERLGEAMGEDWLRSDTEGAYIPSANIHRTPYSGRNFEYYSEDGFLSGEMAAVQARGFQSKGALAFIKHFAFNDQESNRIGVCTFSNEQALREIYLKAFEDAFSVEGAKGTMGAYNRVGCTWSGADEHLMQNVLRGEWGFTGIIDTDAGVSTTLQGPRVGLEAGTNMVATSSETFYNYVMQYAPTDTKLVENLRNSCHYILYNMASSFGVNGLSRNARIIPVTPYWETILLVVNGVLALIAVASAAMMVYAGVKGRRVGTSTGQSVESSGMTEKKGNSGRVIMATGALSALLACITYAMAEVRVNSPVIITLLVIAAAVGVLLCIKRIPYVEYLPLVTTLVSLALFVKLAFDEINDILSKVNMNGLSIPYIFSAVFLLLAVILFEIAPLVLKNRKKQ